MKLKSILIALLVMFTVILCAQTNQELRYRYVRMDASSDSLFDCIMGYFEIYKMETTYGFEATLNSRGKLTYKRRKVYLFYATNFCEQKQYIHLIISPIGNKNRLSKKNEKIQIGHVYHLVLYSMFKNNVWDGYRMMKNVQIGNVKIYNIRVNSKNIYYTPNLEGCCYIQDHSVPARFDCVGKEKRDTEGFKE